MKVLGIGGAHKGLTGAKKGSLGLKLFPEQKQVPQKCLARSYQVNPDCVQQKKSCTQRWPIILIILILNFIINKIYFFLVRKI